MRDERFNNADTQAREMIEQPARRRRRAKADKQGPNQLQSISNAIDVLEARLDTIPETKSTERRARPPVKEKEVKGTTSAVRDTSLKRIEDQIDRLNEALREKEGRLQAHEDDIPAAAGEEVRVPRNTERHARDRTRRATRQTVQSKVDKQEHSVRETRSASSAPQPALRNDRSRQDAEASAASSRQDQSDLIALRNEISDLKTLLHQSTIVGTTDRVMEELSQLSRRIDSLSGDLASNRQNPDEVTQTLDDIRNLLDRPAHDPAVARQCDSILYRLDELVENSSLDGIDKLESRFDELRTMLDRGPQVQQLHDIEDRMQLLFERMDQIRASAPDISPLTQDIDALRTMISGQDATNGMARLEDQLSELADRIDGLGTDDTQGSVDQLTLQMEQLVENLAQHLSDPALDRIADRLAKMDAQMANLATVSETSPGMVRELRAMEDRFDDRLKEFSALSTTAPDLLPDIRAMEDRLDGRLQDLTSRADNIPDLTPEIRAMEDRLDDRLRELSELSVQAPDLLPDIQAMEKRLDNRIQDISEHVDTGSFEAGLGRIEHRLGQLEARDTAKMDEALDRLDDAMSSGGKDPILESLDARLTRLSDTLHVFDPDRLSNEIRDRVSGSISLTTDLGSVEERLDTLSDRIEARSQPEINAPSFDQLEKHLISLAGQLERERDPSDDLGDLKESIQQLEQSIADNRLAGVEETRRIVHDAMEQSDTRKTDTDNSSQDIIMGQLLEDLKILKSAAKDGQAEDDARQLSQMNDVLLTVASRMAALEEAVRAPAPAAPPKAIVEPEVDVGSKRKKGNNAPQVSLHENNDAGDKPKEGAKALFSLFKKRANEIGVESNTASPDTGKTVAKTGEQTEKTRAPVIQTSTMDDHTPLEPGRGRPTILPDRDPLSAPQKASDKRSETPRISGDTRADFIAAARRAAQAAASESSHANESIKGAKDAVTGSKNKSSRMENMRAAMAATGEAEIDEDTDIAESSTAASGISGALKKQRRAIILALAAILLAVGTVNFAPVDKILAVFPQAASYLEKNQGKTTTPIMSKSAPVKSMSANNKLAATQSSGPVDEAQTSNAAARTLAARGPGLNAIGTTGSTRPAKTNMVAPDGSLAFNAQSGMPSKFSKRNIDANAATTTARVSTTTNVPVISDILSRSGPRSSVLSPPALPDAQAVLTPTGDLPIAIGSETLRVSANTGDANAQFEVARRYTIGQGVAQDLKLAAAWYQKAAKQDLAPAQYRLGKLYERGLGVPKDINSALSWYQTAAGHGNIKAMHNIAVLNAEGGLGPVNYKQAFHWFQEAAIRGLRDSQYNLGILYARGLGSNQNLVESYKWFAIAAKQGDPESAKKRDEVAATMGAEKLAEALRILDSWKPLPSLPVANRVSTPKNGWGDGPKQAVMLNMAELVSRTQALLASLGYNAGPADGVMGPQTTTAIRDFERSAGMAETGKITPKLLLALSSRSY